MATLRPKSGYCLVAPIPEPQGAIVIPDVARSDLQSQFKIVATGMGRIKRMKNGKLLRLNPEVGVGQRIVANRYAGRAVECDGQLMRLIEHDSIMAVVSDSTEEQSL